jgi:Uncharacterized protein conserved in bacteria
MTVRNQVEIDYCPSCRGIWLDRGELDKIIAQSEQSYPDQANQPRYRSDDYRDTKYDRERYQGQYPKKKKSFLGDLFDFD